MSWTENIVCTGCRSSFHGWRVVNGVWTCECGKPMTMAEVATYHATLT